MYSRHILLLRRNLELLIQGRLICDSVLGQSCVHVEDLSFSLPCIALGMDIYLFVAIKDLPDRLLTWNLEQILGVAQSIDYTYFLRFFSQLANEVLLILPPWNHQRIFFHIQMHIFSKRNIKLLLTLRIYEGTGISRLLVEPVSYICTSCLYNGLDFRQMPIFLYEVGEIIDIVEKGYPNIIRRVMAFELCESVVSSFVIRFRAELFDIICCTLFTHLLKYEQRIENITNRKIFIIIDCTSSSSLSSISSIVWQVIS